MNALTLIFIRATNIGGRQFYFGDELPPDVLSAEQIERALDARHLAETERRSLYRILHHFSGCVEQDQTTKQ